MNQRGGNRAFDSSHSPMDDTNNYIDVTIVGDKIEATSQTNNSSVAIAQLSSENNTWSIYAHAYNIGAYQDEDSLDTNWRFPLDNTISFGADNVLNIVGSGGAYFRFNNDSSQLRFRYYKSTTYTQQQPIHLYKKNE